MISLAVLPGHGRPEDDLASFAYPPGIYVVHRKIHKDVDGRDKPGHDESCGCPG
jgi:hypothetical protein